MEKILNIGCGRNKLLGAVNLDLNHTADVVFDLESCGKMIVTRTQTAGEAYGIGEGRMPFDDNEFDSVQASHTLEHIRNILPLMQELHRVTKPGGIMMIRVPYGSNHIAFEDPTHVRHFFPKSFIYFGQPAYNNADYGYRGDWKMVECIVAVANEYEGCPEDELRQLLENAWNVGEELYVTLECVKPIRVPDGIPSKLEVRWALQKDIQSTILREVAAANETEQ